MISAFTECDPRIILLGKTGTGKSATGNTILGRKAFEVFDSMKSANKLCEKKEGKVGGKTVSIVDTPGLFNLVVTKQQMTAELQKCVVLSAPGPHVFLLVIKLGVRFTKEEREAVKWIQENFGEEALSRTIILFTHADQLKGKPVEDYINKSNYLMEIVESCGGSYHSFNNEDRNHQDQVTELLNKINSMMEENEMSYYTLEMFKTAQKKKRERKMAKAACAVAMLGFGILGTTKILDKIFAAIAGSASGAAVESAIEATGEAAGETVDKHFAVIENAIETARKALTLKAVIAVEKAVETAGKTAANKAVVAIEQAVETAGEAVPKRAVEAAEKAVEIAGEAVAMRAVAAVEKAGEAAAKKALAVIEEVTQEAVQTAASGTGVAAQGISAGLAAAISAAAARSAAAAGKVASSGRVSAVAAVAAAFGGAAVALMSALK